VAKYRFSLISFVDLLSIIVRITVYTSTHRWKRVFDTMTRMYCRNMRHALV